MIRRGLGASSQRLDLANDLVQYGFMQVNIHEAKTHLSRLLNRVISGEEVIISKAGKPLAKLVPFDKPRKKRIPGRDRALGKIARDFNAPLPDELLEAFER